MQKAPTQGQSQSTRVAPNRRTTPSTHNTLPQLPDALLLLQERHMHTHARTQTRGQYNMGGVRPGVPALTRKKADRWWRGRLPVPPPIPFCEMGGRGGFASCLGRGGWKLLSQKQTSMGGDRGRNSLPPFPARAESSRVWFGLAGAMGRRLQQDEQAYASRGKVHPTPSCGAGSCSRGKMSEVGWDIVQSA